MRPIRLLPLLALPALLASCVQGGAPSTVTASAAAPLPVGTATAKPRGCVFARDLQGRRSPDNRTLLFRIGASRFVRSDLPRDCPRLSDNRYAIAVRSPTGSYCEGDLFDLFDPVTGIYAGSCTFGPFTPVELPPGERF